MSINQMFCKLSINVIYMYCCFYIFNLVNHYLNFLYFDKIVVFLKKNPDIKILLHPPPSITKEKISTIPIQYIFIKPLFRRSIVLLKVLK